MTPLHGERLMTPHRLRLCAGSRHSFNTARQDVNEDALEDALADAHAPDVHNDPDPQAGAAIT